MKFRFNPKKFNIRIGIWLTFALSIFFIALIIKFGLPDSINSLGSCIKDSGTILRTDEITYIDISPIKKKRTKERALVITMIEKPYKIWLTDMIDRKYWPLLNNENSQGKTIDYYYVDRLLQDTILYNPKRLDLNGVEIIKFYWIQRRSIISVILLTFILLITNFVFITCTLTYKDHLLKGDLMHWKRPGIKPKLKVLLDWITN